MGMRIQGGATGYAIAAQDNQWQQRRQNFDALSQAVSGGNLSSATDALTKIQASLPSGQSIDPNSFLGKIDAALQSGDIITAQQLLAARSTGSGDQSASAGSVQQAGAASAANGTTATGATSGASATSGRHGLHRHHGGGSSSPARDLSQAIQSGDTAKAQSSMLAILTDLQQVICFKTQASRNWKTPSRKVTLRRCRVLGRNSLLALATQALLPFQQPHLLRLRLLRCRQQSDARYPTGKSRSCGFSY